MHISRFSNKEVIELCFLPKKELQKLLRNAETKLLEWKKIDFSTGHPLSTYKDDEKIMSEIKVYTDILIRK